MRSDSGLGMLAEPAAATERLRFLYLRHVSRRVILRLKKLASPADCPRATDRSTLIRSPGVIEDVDVGGDDAMGSVRLLITQTRPARLPPGAPPFTSR